ncbi:hypothetical protein F5878DRAFT_666795 [Lentinula raphanica]|uniref:Uncharacterized protein n=1 Tax=Lentinula raphanica TaxID=153919 RepID=A0AA38NX17_9AGAR|nr:hypothetical protein F5878DRAFT_666795 [Lentinula raphanica]
MQFLSSRSPSIETHLSTPSSTLLRHISYISPTSNSSAMVKIHAGVVILGSLLQMGVTSVLAVPVATSVQLQEKGLNSVALSVVGAEASSAQHSPRSAPIATATNVEETKVVRRGPKAHEFLERLRKHFTDHQKCTPEFLWTLPGDYFPEMAENIQLKLRLWDTRLTKWAKMKINERLQQWEANPTDKERKELLAFWFDGLALYGRCIFRSEISKDFEREGHFLYLDNQVMRGKILVKDLLDTVTPEFRENMIKDLKEKSKDKSTPRLVKTRLRQRIREFNERPDNPRAKETLGWWWDQLMNEGEFSKYNSKYSYELGVVSTELYEDHDLRQNGAGKGKAHYY